MMLEIATRCWDLFTHVGVQYLDGLKITSQCQSSIFINLYIRRSLVQTVRRLRFRLEPTKCTHELSSVSQLIGSTNKGETPKETARREALEEASLTVGELFAVSETYPSPGNSSEFHFIYVGIADLHDEVTGIAGVASEDEDIRSHVMPFEVLLAACDRRARNRDTLLRKRDRRKRWLCP